MVALVVPPVTPVAGLTSVVGMGGTAVTAVPGNVNGGFITNPASNVDQNLVVAEDLFVDPVGSAGLGGNGTTFRIPPGGTWVLIPGQTTPTTVNAESSGHLFSVVYF
jgi:hypothetical protein